MGVHVTSRCRWGGWRWTVIEKTWTTSSSSGSVSAAIHLTAHVFILCFLVVRWDGSSSCLSFCLHFCLCYWSLDETEVRDRLTGNHHLLQLLSITYKRNERQIQELEDNDDWRAHLSLHTTLNQSASSSLFILCWLVPGCRRGARPWSLFLLPSFHFISFNLRRREQW